MPLVYASLAAAGLLAVGAWFFLVAGGERDEPAIAMAPTTASVIKSPPPPPPAVDVGPPPPKAPPRIYWSAEVLGTFDPTHFDAEAFVPRALSEARKHFKDPTLVWFSAVDVGADGMSDLTTGSQRAVSYAFRNAVSPDAGVGCLYWVYVDEKGAWSEPSSRASEKLCALRTAELAKRRCSLAQVLARVAEKNPPRAGRTHAVRWSFDSLNNGTIRADWTVSGFPTFSNDAATDLSWGFADDCGGAK
jgi:hypothetical protein